MHRDMNHVFIETTVRRTLKEIRESPERGIRNLIDLGLTFSRGRFQQHFLSTAQQMLCNEKSAYYKLLRDVLTNVDPEILTAFGVNVGYNSCTKGAQIIREIEAKQGFNVPWALSLFINQEKLSGDPNLYSGIVKQGAELGIYTDLIFTGDEPSILSSLLIDRRDCAFLLFVEGAQVTDAWLESMKPVKNTMVVVHSGEDLLPACRKLRKANMLYAVYSIYTREDKVSILSGEWLSDVLRARPAFAFLMADRCCPEEMQQEIDTYVLSVRKGQEHPVFLLDVKHDMLRIDRIISDDVCMVGFGKKGCMLTHEGIFYDSRLNIFEQPLEDILRRKNIW